MKSPPLPLEMADHNIRILVTGFGTVSQALNNVVNPSFEIVSRLPRSFPGVDMIAHPEALRSAYHWLVQTSPQLIRTYKPDIVLHVGVDVGRDYFSVERGAARDGYHEYPDLDRRTITRNESQKIWGRKSAERLDTTLNLDATVEAWQVCLKINRRVGNKGNTRNKGPNTRQPVPDVRVTDDVGNYVCGLLYYASLAELEEQNPGKMDAVFLHVPMLSGEEELERGVSVVSALIRALAETWTR